MEPIITAIIGSVPVSRSSIPIPIHPAIQKITAAMNVVFLRAAPGSPFFNQVIENTPTSDAR